MVEGTGLENRRAVKRTEGSNPSPSAKTVLLTLKNRRFIRVSYFLLVMMEVFLFLLFGLNCTFVTCARKTIKHKTSVK